MAGQSEKSPPREEAWFCWGCGQEIALREGQDVVDPDDGCPNCGGVYLSRVAAGPDWQEEENGENTDGS